MLTKLSDKPMQFSRRGFVQAAAALGASAALYGCGSSGGDDVIIGGGGGGYYPPMPDLTTDEYFYGSGGHNCGNSGRCIVTAWVKNSRVVRITSDDTLVSGNGQVQDPDSYLNRSPRACARCRGYRDRLYHPGRLKYPLKQTKKRGDLSGFVRLTWDQALNEIVRKHKAITTKYGPESMHNLYACGSYTGSLQGGGYNGVWIGSSASSYPARLIGGYTPYTHDYSFHQSYVGASSYTGWNLTGMTGTAGLNEVAGCVKTLVLWGSNNLSTQNPAARGIINATRMMRAREGTQIIHISPEFVDTGVNIATKWVQIKPYTDTALMLAMMYEMIVNTFDTNGNIMSNPWLNVDYLDTVVYGFFDSPEYWIKTTTGTPPQGTISLTDPGATGYSYIDAVPAGRSLSAYIMGNDERLTKALYSTGSTYVAQQFASLPYNGSPRPRNLSTCSYTIRGVPAHTILGTPNTNYQRKKDYMTPKSPDWAEKITGVPAETIRELAKMYCTAENQPILSEWSGAFQKQSEGVINLLSQQVLNLVSGTYGMTGVNITRNSMGASSGTGGTEAMPDLARYQTAPTNPSGPVPSVTQWHNAIKFAFGDVLKANGYNAKYIPDWNPNDIGTGKVYHDDGGAKALVKWQRTGTAVNRDANGYYIPDTSSGGIVYSGFRFIMNSGGNILINQHMNSNDSRDVYEAIPSCGQTNNPDDPDDLCLVSFDNFLSPSPRWSDYVLPAATQWEMENRISLTLGGNIIIPVVSQPPGEAKSTYDFTIAFLRAYERIDAAKSGAVDSFIGSDTSGGTVIPNDKLIDKFKRAFERQNFSRTSRYYRRSFDEALKIQFSSPDPSTMNPTATVTKTSLRTGIETYLASSTRGTTPYYLGANATGVTNYGGDFSTAVSATLPNVSRRAEVYIRRLPWHYENRFEAWHGWLPAGQRGQNNVDPEGDPMVLPLTMYYNYEDYFMEAYGGPDKLPSAGNRFLLTTTHDRYRAHSSYAEAPLLRELTHRVRDGKVYSGNDWGTYALSDIGSGGPGTISRLNKSIAEKDFTRASWSEVWMNDEDASAHGIQDGEIIQLENAIGAVRVAARVTKRAVKGYLALHQGCWYDPDPADGVDDGGCANTLMATKPSRVDHGNGQQSAMVKISKVTF